jgi:hypothetical protein
MEIRLQRRGQLKNLQRSELKGLARSIHKKREQIAALREELEELNDYLDLVGAGVRDEGKPRLTHDQVKKRYGVK